MADREAPITLTEVQIAQGANVLDDMITKVINAKMTESGAWQKDRVQALYESVMHAGENLSAASHARLLGIMLALAIDQIAESRTP